MVIPWAQAKIYLHADLTDRTRRRIAELKRLNLPAEYEIVKKAVEERDKYDSTRENSPLRVSEQAVYLDTTGMGLDTMLKRVMEIAGPAWDAWKNTIKG